MKNIPVRHLHPTQQEPKFTESFTIRDLRELLDGKDMVQELHRHDFFLILAIKKGSGHHAIDFISYEVGNYSIFVMNPGQVHELTLKGNCTGYLIQFNVDFYYAHDRISDQMLTKVSKANHYQLDPNDFKKYFTILADIFEEYSEKKAQYEEVIRASLRIFFIALTRRNNNDTSRKINSYTQEKFDTLSHLLDTHITTCKEVRQYAELMSLSVYQLNAITKAAQGKTCSEVINDHIVLESKRLLLATSNQVNQIAYHLGYDDVSYFIRFFKKHTGYSPEAFRHNFK
jgi:AraC-like DNA-binding protein